MSDYTKDADFIQTRERFQEIVTTSEVNRQSIILAWEYYLASIQRRNEIIEASDEFGAAQTLKVLNALEDKGSHGTGVFQATVNIALIAFKYGVYEEISQRTGVMLDGLEGEALQRAISFSNEMEVAARDTRAFNEKFPKES